MTLFPSIAPIQPATEATSPFASKLLLGDGYERALRFGLNTSRPEWQLEWLVDGVQALVIDGFLQDQADAGTFFQWQPPDAGTPLNWRCDEWTVEQRTAIEFSVKATFRRVYELSLIQVTPAEASCNNDYLCEPDFGMNNQADFWLSRITSPISNQDPQIYGTGAPRGHSIVMDNQGYSYHVWCYAPYTGFTYPYGWLVITKRDLGGNIIWTKKTTMSYVCRGMRYASIQTIGNQQKLVVIATTTVGYTSTVPVFSIDEDWCMTFSLQGDFESAFSTYLPVGFGISHSSTTNNFVCCAGDVGAVSPFYNVLNKYTGAFVTNWYTRIPGTIYASGDLASDGGMVQFDDTNQLVFWNIGGNRLQVIKLTSYAPASTSSIISMPGGASCTAVKYGNTALVFVGPYIYQYDSDGLLMRRLTMPGVVGNGGAWAVQLDEENGNIYINSGGYVYTLSYDLTTVKTFTYLNPGGITYAGRNGTSQGGQNMLSLNANRFVLSMDTLQGYGLSANGGRALLMAAGGRLSEVGSLVTMNAGGFTATAQGALINTPLSSTAGAAISSYEQSLLIFQGTTSAVTGLRTLTVTDATSEYTWGLYDTKYV